MTQPDVVYLHNPADKHPTHVAVVGRTIQELRKMSNKPSLVYGCEVWRDLDWLPDELKVVWDVSKHQELGDILLRVYASQNQGGKRYDLASVGRRRANATYLDSHGVDTAESVIFGVNLTPLLHNNMPLEVFVLELIDKFREDVRQTMKKAGLTE